jgi:glutathione synthase/RimK-type ligase-like ATP-grasp enzyme
LIIPATVGVAHSRLTDVAEGHLGLKDLSSDLAFPVIVRPRGSHAGRGLAKIDDCEALRGYLSDRSDDEFFVARFVDYSDDRGTFRKYRIVAVEGRFFACHMAIADQWDIWYLNAGMLFDAGKRAEEAAFMQTFDEAFAVRHGRALSGMMERVGLDYFTVDCAEDRDGNLLIFEVDNTAVVHNMDPADIYPYKGPQMHAIFKAFAAMLTRAARQQWERAQSAQDS